MAVVNLLHVLTNMWYLT